MLELIRRDRGWSLVLGFLAVSATIYLLQLFPFTGIFLMLFGASLWIGALTHLLMLALTIVALTGDVARWWISLPILYYGGGYALHLTSIHLATNESAAIEKANAAQSAHVETPFTYTAADFGALELLERFQAPLEQSGQTKYRYQSVQYSVVYRTEYHSGEACGSPAMPSADPFAPWLFRNDLFPSEKPADKTRQCLVRQMIDVGAAPTEKPHYLVREVAERSRTPSFLLVSYLKRWTATDLRTNQMIAEVVEGDLYPLPAVQFIIAGCALDSGTPAWRCGAGLMRGSESIAIGYKKRTDSGNPFTPVSDPETSRIYALGKALGLTPRTPTDR
jgi:hypothetical protein